jgi:hypothetical protein
MESVEGTAGLMDGIGVGEEEPPALRLLRAGPAGLGFASKGTLMATEFQWRCFKDTDAWVAGGEGMRELTGVVCGVVIDDKDLPVAAELEVVVALVDEGVEAVGEIVLLVARGDDDGELERSFCDVRFDGQRRRGFVDGKAEDGAELRQRGVRCVGHRLSSFGAA